MKDDVFINEASVPLHARIELLLTAIKSQNHLDVAKHKKWVKNRMESLGAGILSDAAYKCLGLMPKQKVIYWLRKIATNIENEGL